MFPYFNEDPHSPVRGERREERVGTGRREELRGDARRCEERREEAGEKIGRRSEVEKKR